MWIVGPRETMDREFRVGLVPDGARALVEAGHDVWVERGSGVGSGFAKDAYPMRAQVLLSCRKPGSSRTSSSR
jgi:alanine dehydrogenase